MVPPVAMNPTTQHEGHLDSTVYPRFRWFVLLALTIATAGQQIVMISFAPLMGVIARDLNISLGNATGAFMGGFNLFVAISSLLGGHICDRWGTTRAMFSGLVLLTVSSLALPLLGHSLGMILLLRCIQGLGAGPILTSGAPIAAHWFPKSERGILTGVQSGGAGLGLALGFYCAPMAYVAAGHWQNAMAWLTPICFLGMALTVMVPLGPKPPVATVHLSSGFHVSQAKADFKRACRHRVTWVAVSLTFCGCWLLNGFNDLVPGHLAIDPPVGAGYGPVTAGKLMTVVQIAYLLGSFATGLLLSVLFKGNIRRFAMTGFAAYAVVALAIRWPAVYSNVPVLLSCLAVAGFFQGWLMPGALTFIALNYPAHITGKVVGMAFSASTFGGAVAVFCGAAALRGTGNYHLSIYIVGAVALLGCVLSQMLRAPKELNHAHGSEAAPAIARDGSSGA